MKKQQLILLCLSLIFTQISFAAVKDASTNPNEYYLLEHQSPDSLLLLPPPPAFDSVDFMRDKILHDAAKAMRDTPRGKQAYRDADAKSSNMALLFSPAFGFPISADETPAIYTLISTMKEDAGDLSTRSAKNYYNRVRPFSFLNEPTCRPEDQVSLSTNGSYPSGHTAIGWAIALILAEINPDRQAEILKRGFEIGQSRVICGYHWQSDIDAARVMASAVVARLHAQPAFIAQLEKAKAEMKTRADTIPKTSKLFIK